MEPHKTFAQKFIDSFGFTPTASGELTQEQLDYIASQINVSGNNNTYFPQGW
jgi:hypothetical protein